jgi:C4-type Zn-finger protein
MSLEWFDRVCGELQNHLESICEEYDQVGQMAIEKAAKHPRIEFFVNTADADTEEFERDYFCTLFFDPQNEEFYVDTFDVESGHTAKVILSDIEDLIDEVHESLHNYMNDDDHFADDGVYLASDEVFDNDGGIMMVDNEDGYADSVLVNSDDIFEEIDVEWSTPEVTAYKHGDEVEVTYQFGVVHETGDGVLRRVNRVLTTEDELIEDESNFVFSKEEASTIIAMISSHMDQLSEFDFDSNSY